MNMTVRIFIGAWYFSVAVQPEKMIVHLQSFGASGSSYTLFAINDYIRMVITMIKYYDQNQLWRKVLIFIL